MQEQPARGQRTIDFMTFVYWKGAVARRFAEALVIHDPDVTATLDRHFEADQQRSLLLDASTWSRRGRVQRAREVASHVATFGLRGGGASERDGLLRSRG